MRENTKEDEGGLFSPSEKGPPCRATKKGAEKGSLNGRDEAASRFGK